MGYVVEIFIHLLFLYFFNKYQLYFIVYFNCIILDKQIHKTNINIFYTLRLLLNNDIKYKNYDIQIIKKNKIIIYKYILYLSTIVEY